MVRRAPGLGSFALLFGLFVNIGFNLLLLPTFGLEGAVWATTLANLIALVLIYLLSRLQGMHVDLGTWILSLAPAVLSLGPWISLGVLIALGVAAATTNRVLTSEETPRARSICTWLAKIASRGALPSGRAARSCVSSKHRCAF